MSKKFVILYPYVNVDWEIDKFLTVAEVKSVAIPSQEELIRQIRDVDLLVADVDLKVNQDVLKAATQLRAIACTATGVDYVDIAEATGKGIVVTNLPDYSVEAVAEHTLALMFCLSRNIYSGMKSVLRGGGTRSGSYREWKLKARRWASLAWDGLGNGWLKKHTLWE
jgi:phosphoglycerate dehydrogenase-like enzyme